MHLGKNEPTISYALGYLFMFFCDFTFNIMYIVRQEDKNEYENYRQTITYEKKGNSLYIIAYDNIIMFLINIIQQDV